MIDQIILFLMLVVTYSGGYLVVAIVTLLSVGSFVIHKQAARIAPLFFSLVSSSAIVFLLKNVLGRARPEGAIYLETTPSFPSWHATIAVALYGFLLYTTWKQDKHPLRDPLIYFLAILIILIGASRLYLGVHYLSDVLAGYAIGLLCLLSSLFLFAAISKSKS